MILARGKDKTMEYIEHHGIKGQKWGVRRFQNEDGTRTAAGKARERDGSGNSGSSNSFSVKATAHKVAAKVYSINEKTYAKSNKALSSMNEAAKNEQLKKAAEAQRLSNQRTAEKQKAKEIKKEYKQEKTQEYNNIRKNRSTGKKVVDTMLGGSYGIGNRAVSRLMASGVSERNARILNATVGALGSTVIADIRINKQANEAAKKH